MRTDLQGHRALCFDEIGDGDHRRLVRFIFDCQRAERRRGLEQRWPWPVSTRSRTNHARPHARFLAEHPRAARAITRAKAWGGLAGFLIGGYLSLPTETLPAAGLRALAAGVICYVAVWAGAVFLWRRLVVAELRGAQQAEVARRLPAAASPSTLSGPTLKDRPRLTRTGVKSGTVGHRPVRCRVLVDQRLTGSRPGTNQPTVIKEMNACPSAVNTNIEALDAQRNLQTRKARSPRRWNASPRA